MATTTKAVDAVRISATFTKQAGEIVGRSAAKAGMSKDRFTAAWAVFGAAEIKAGRAAMVNGQPKLK